MSELNGYHIPIDITPPQRDPLAELPALAERLGVPPVPANHEGVTLHTQDGRHYDVFALVNAALDRLDRASAPAKPTPRMASDDDPEFPF
jgi:hypothetical protein